jgi:ferritin-like metal-binding protein YciE
MADENPLFELFHDTLRDIYWAEKHLLKALPKLAKNAANEDLAQAFEDHRAETEGQVERLEHIFGMIDKKPRGKKCEAMAGLSEEADHVIDEVEDDMARDAGIIGAAQAVEHYEIARYGTLAAWARLLGEDEAARLLEETLEEEKAADKKLTMLSQAINREAESSRAAA